MAGLPVTIRLLDPPLHEFLPSVDELKDEVARRADEEPGAGASSSRSSSACARSRRRTRCWARAAAGSAILYPEICSMQVAAIVRAALAVAERSGSAPKLEIMIPLVAYEKELEFMRDLVEAAVEEQGGSDLELSIGTMLELPRACLLANLIAEKADFFSFGTNDLTQTALGFSRDDVEGKFLARYIDRGILDRSPFETLDEPGVGELVRMGGVARAQRRSPISSSASAASTAATPTRSTSSTARGSTT